MSVFKRGTYLTSEKWTLNYNGMNQLTDRSLYLTDGSSTLRDKWVYTYDGAGNLKTQEYQNGSLVKQLKWFFTWNPRNQMTLAERFTGTNDTYAGKVTYRYCLSCDSVLSERIEYSPTVSTTITSWKRYEYDGLNLLRMDGRYDTAGGALDDNDPLRTLEVSTHKSGSLGALIGKRVYTHTNNDATPDSTNDYTYTYDAVGNVLAIYNANSTGRGNELYYFTQDAFGIELTTSPFSGTVWSTARTAGITEHQTGKWIDPFTGLYFFHARWYDSGVGRFVGRSDIFRGREHPYLFCHSNPLKWKDPSGTEPSPDEFEKYKNLVCKRLKEWADRNSGSGFKDFAISCSGLIRCCWEGSEAFYEWGSWKGCTRAMEDVLGILEDGIPEGCHAQEIRLGFHWTVWINCESYGSWWLDPWRLKCDNAGGFCNGHPQWNPAPTPTPNPNPSPPIPKPPTPVPPSPGVQEGMTYCTACGR